jgi:hypothetical protein
VGLESRPSWYLHQPCKSVELLAGLVQAAWQAGTCTTPASRLTWLLGWYLHQPIKQADPLAGLVPEAAHRAGWPACWAGTGFAGLVWVPAWQAG